MTDATPRPLAGRRRRSRRAVPCSWGWPASGLAACLPPRGHRRQGGAAYFGIPDPARPSPACPTGSSPWGWQRRPDARRLRALDPAGPGPAGRRGDARRQRPGPLAGGPGRRGSPTWSPTARCRPRPRSGHSVHIDVTRLAARPGVLLPLHHRRPGVPGRPHPHRSPHRAHPSTTSAWPWPAARAGPAATTAPGPRWWPTSPTSSCSWATTSTRAGSAAASGPTTAARS